MESLDGSGRQGIENSMGHRGSSDPSGTAIYLNNGTSDPFGGVTPLRFLAGETVEAVAVADLNGDGKSDLVAVVSNGSLVQNNLYVFLNTGSASAPYGNPRTLQPDSDLGGGCIDVSVGDVNGDSLPDLLFSCVPPSPTASPRPAKPAVGAIYLNNGTADPFANVAPVDIPAKTPSDYGRSVAVGTFVRNGNPNVLIVDGGFVASGQSGAASYYLTKLDQIPVAQDDPAVCAITNQSRSMCSQMTPQDRARA
jgi:FG-GAP repeat